MHQIRCICSKYFQLFWPEREKAQGSPGFGRCAQNCTKYGAIFREWGLAYGLRQEFHVSNVRRHSETLPRAPVLNPDHRRLTADPALFALREFRGQNQDQFEFAPRLYPGVGIEEDSAYAKVASMPGRLLDSTVRADRYGDLRRNPLSRSPLCLGLSHRRAETTTQAQSCPAGKTSASGSVSD